MSNPIQFEDTERPYLGLPKPGDSMVFVLKRRLMVDTQFGESIAYDVDYPEDQENVADWYAMRIFPPTVLATKLSTVEMGYLVQVENLGKPDGKRYLEWRVGQAGLWSYDPDEAF